MNCIELSDRISEIEVVVDKANVVLWTIVEGYLSRVNQAPEALAFYRDKYHTFGCIAAEYLSEAEKALKELVMEVNAHDP